MDFFGGAFDALGAAAGVVEVRSDKALDLKSLRRDEGQGDGPDVVDFVSRVGVDDYADRSVLGGNLWDYSGLRVELEEAVAVLGVGSGL